MHFFYQVTVPASTLQSNPYTIILGLSRGRIKHVDVFIPAGHAGTAHLQLLYHEVQIYPLNRGGSYLGDNIPVSFSDDFALDSSPYEFKAIGWNTDTVNSHAFLVGIEVERSDEGTVITDATTLAQLRDLAGTAINV